MKYRYASNLREILAIVGSLGSFLGLIVAITVWLGISRELTLSLISVIIAVLGGIYSMSVARFAKRLPRARRVFLSYSHEANPVANNIATKLRDAGVKVWLDIEQLQLGEPIEAAIRHAIRDADTVIILLPQSESPNMEYELKIANEERKRIIPVVVENTPLPLGLGNLKYVDLRSSPEKGIQELVNAAS